MTKLRSLVNDSERFRVALLHMPRKARHILRDEVALIASGHLSESLLRCAGGMLRLVPSQELQERERLRTLAALERPVLTMEAGLVLAHDRVLPRLEVAVGTLQQLSGVLPSMHRQFIGPLVAGSAFRADEGPKGNLYEGVSPSWLQPGIGMHRHMCL